MDIKLKNREEAFSFFESYSQNSKEQIDERKTRNPLLKSYVFETFNEGLEGKLKESLEIPNLFKQKDLTIKQIDEKFFIIKKHSNFIGCIEQINNRFSVFYTNIPANTSDNLIKNYIKDSTILDSMWISGKMYDQLLKHISDIHHPHRFTKLKFEYDLKFDKKIHNDEILEHKASTISFVEDLVDIIPKIEGVRQYLPLFHAMSSLRLPSKLGAGGHDFYHNGKVTNRSTSFYDHRLQIKDLVSNYQFITEYIENKAWVGLEKIPSKIESSVATFNACPITIIFNEPISTDVLNSFVHTTFSKGTEPFKIIGDIYEAGKNRFHIYGTDMHLWQNIFLDLSTSSFNLYLPYGTCGNTIHRFITHIQKYLQPNLQVYIGDKLYDEIIYEHLGGMK